MDDKKKPNKFEQKHDWVGENIYRQTILARLLGFCEYHDVPFTALEKKIESAYQMIGDTKNPEKTWLAVKNRVLKENPDCKSFCLKPIYISLIDRGFQRPGMYIIFRIKNDKTGEPMYLDQIRTYSNWADFLENNTLPKLFLMYPKDGDYTKETELILEESVACSPVKVARQITKITAVSVTIASTAALVATPFVPILAPATTALYLAAAGSGAVMGIDGAVQIKDLVDHKECMSPTNLRALDAYLDIGSACGGLVSGGASTAARFLKEDAETVAKILRVLKIVGSTAQNVSLLMKCLTPVMYDIKLEDFQNFCLIFLNILVDIKEGVPWARLFIELFSFGFALYTGNVIAMLQSVRTVNELANILCTSVLRPLLRTMGPHIQELGIYLGNLLCNKYRDRLPSLIAYKNFDCAKQDFLSIVEKANAFFQVPDILSIKFNKFQIFLTFSITGLRLAQGMLESHLKCKESGEPHSLKKPLLVKIWFRFMDLIMCCSPRTLIQGTYFLLCKMNSTNLNSQGVWEDLPSNKRLTAWADDFLNEREHGQQQFNVDVPAFPAIDGMELHEFYSPHVGGDKRVLSKELKTDYRQKVEVILRKRVTRENSRFHKDGNGSNAVLYLSQCHGCRAVVFNRTFLDNGNVFLLVTTLK